jgi:hypothetical protein
MTESVARDAPPVLATFARGRALLAKPRRAQAVSTIRYAVASHGIEHSRFTESRQSVRDEVMADFAKRGRFVSRDGSTVSKAPVSLQREDLELQLRLKRQLLEAEKRKSRVAMWQRVVARNKQPRRLYGPSVLEIR